MVEGGNRLGEEWFLTDSKEVMMSSMGRRGKICHLFKRITHCVEDSNFHFCHSASTVASTLSVSSLGAAAEQVDALGAPFTFERN